MTDAEIVAIIRERVKEWREQPVQPIGVLDNLDPDKIAEDHEQVRLLACALRDEWKVDKPTDLYYCQPWLLMAARLLKAGWKR